MRPTDRIYGALCQSVLLPLGDRLSGQRVMQHFRTFSDAQWWDRERVARMQDQALERTVRAAYTDTEFYRRLYDAAGVKPSDIRSLADLPKLPAVGKEMLRDAYPHECTRDTGLRWQELSTSGSTGKPLTVRIDGDGLSAARALMLLRATYSGWAIGESLLQTGMSLQRGTVRAWKDRLLRTTYISAFDLSDPALDHCLEVLDRRRVGYVMGYAAGLYLLARRAKAVGFNRRLKGVVSWGDNLFAHYRGEIERQFGCRVTDTYGCGEGIQVSAQCGHSDGSYHIFALHVVVEFTRQGQAVAPGQLGEILLTRLDAGAMPLIRYRIGDVGRADPRQECPCGRTLPLMKSIDGRSTDIVVTPSGKRLIVHFFTGIFEYARSIDTFQVIQDKPDRITVRVVPRGELDRQEWATLTREIKEKGDPELHIDLELVDSIPLEQSNKRRFVVSRVAL